MELLRSDTAEYIFQVTMDDDVLCVGKRFFGHEVRLFLNRAEARTMMHTLEDYFHDLDAAG